MMEGQMVEGGRKGITLGKEGVAGSEMTWRVSMAEKHSKQQTE